MIDHAIMSELRQIREELRAIRERESIQPIAVSTDTAAKMLGVCTKTLIAWTNDGKIERFVEGGVYRYRVADLEAFTREHRRALRRWLCAELCAEWRGSDRKPREESRAGNGKNHGFHQGKRGFGRFQITPGRTRPH